VFAFYTVVSIMLAGLLSACNVLAEAERWGSLAFAPGAAVDELQATPQDEAVLLPTPVEPASAPSVAQDPAVTSPPLAEGCIPRADWHHTYTVTRGDTLFSIAQRAGSNVQELAEGNCLIDPSRIGVGQILRVPNPIGTPEEQPPAGVIPYYVISQTDDGGGIPVGCDGYMMPVRTGFAFAQDPAANIQASLGPLLAMPSTEVGESGYVNYLGGQGLWISSLSVSDGHANLTLGGPFRLIGTCADPQIEAQILLSVFADPRVSTASITVNGQNLKQMVDMSGQTGPDAIYTRSDIRRRQ
jgi:LysM repeat protein